MFERLNTPEEIYSFKLGSALSMERKLVEVLEELEQHAQRPEIKSALAAHREETIQHVTNVERCFTLLGEEIDDWPCLVVEAMAKEGKATIKKTDDSIVDAIITTLDAGNAQTAQKVKTYERDRKARVGVIESAEKRIAA